MSDGSADVSRRGFLAATAGGAAAVGAAGTAAAQDNETGGGNESAGGNGADGNATDGGNETAGGDGAGGNETDGGGGGGAPEPDFGGYLDDAPYFDGTVEDVRGEEQPTVTVGGDANGTNSFLPAAIHVDNGATVVWEWTGQGSHNVVHEGGEFESDLTGEEGFTFERTFEEDGIYNYYCDPHESMGMLGSVVVGTDYPSVDQGGGGEGPQPLPGSVKTLGVATLTTLVATLGLAYAFIKYGGSGPREP